jgi:hypothetical protein
MSIDFMHSMPLCDAIFISQPPYFKAAAQFIFISDGSIYCEIKNVPHDNMRTTYGKYNTMRLDAPLFPSLIRRARERERMADDAAESHSSGSRALPETEYRSAGRIAQLFLKGMFAHTERERCSIAPPLRLQ